MPCIVGMWGYYMNLMGIDEIRQHWRYLVARYGALPVVWCLAGEVQMSVYSVMRAGGQAHADALAEQADGWTEMSHYVRAIDPFHSLVTTHPAAIGTSSGAAAIAAASLGPRPAALDPSCTTTPSSTSTCSSAATTGSSSSSRRWTSCRRPSPSNRVMPLVNGEVNYEGIAGSCWQEQQRFQFWTCMLDGGAGYSYGAAGLWVFWNRTTFSKGGDSEFMEDAGGGPWEDVMHLPGSAQVGIGKRILERFPWWRFERIDEPRAVAIGRASSFAAGIPGVVPIYFVPVRAGARVPPRDPRGRRPQVFLVADAAADPGRPGRGVRGVLDRPADRRRDAHRPGPGRRRRLLDAAGQAIAARLGARVGRS